MMMKDEEWAMKQDMKFVLANTSQQEKRELWHCYINAVIALKGVPRVISFEFTRKFWKDARAEGSTAAIKKWEWLPLLRIKDKTINDIEAFLNNPGGRGDSNLYSL